MNLVAQRLGQYRGRTETAPRFGTPRVANSGRVAHVELKSAEIGRIRPIQPELATDGRRQTQFGVSIRPWRAYSTNSVGGYSTNSVGGPTRPTGWRAYSTNRVSALLNQTSN
jgi:hypothetical protein